MNAVKLSVTIMAHPRRSSMVAELSDLLDITPTVVWDHCEDRWDTGRRAWLAHDPSATHHMMIQDDAVVCQDLHAGVARLIGHLSASRQADPIFMCLYLGHKYRKAPRAFDGETSWLHTTLGSGVAIVAPTQHIREMIRFADQIPQTQNYDLRLGKWLFRRKIPVWHPWPSLVDHHESESLVPGRGSKSRCAWNFIGTEASALDFNPDNNIGVIPDRVYDRAIQSRGISLR